MNSLLISLKFFGILLAELTVLFLAVSTLVGLAFAYVSDETLRKWLSRKGWQGYFLGATLGAITPFCSCSTIPLTVGLLKAGVPFGATMSFLLASPLLNPIILTMFLALLGWKVCVAYAIVTFGMAMIAGAILAKSGFQAAVKSVRIVGTPIAKDTTIGFKGKLAHAFAGATSDFRNVFPYLVIGIAAGAVIYGYVPADFVVRVAGSQNPLAVPIAAIIGIPLYVRAETVIPLSVALTQKGMSMGAAIALVIGGAGMSIPEMSMLASIFKFRLVAVFVFIVFLTAVLTGFVVNFL